MKELLNGAGNILQQCAEEEDDLGRTGNAAELNAMAAALHDLAETADLRDELWAAAKLFSENQVSNSEVTMRLIVACDKVADTDGK